MWVNSFATVARAIVELIAGGDKRLGGRKALESLEDRGHRRSGGAMWAAWTGLDGDKWLPDSALTLRRKSVTDNPPNP